MGTPAIAGARERLRLALKPIGLDGAHQIADRIGVWRGLGNRALNARKINASAFVQFCCALGLDPYTGGSAPVLIRGPILWWFFGAAVVMQRLEDDMTQVEAAKAAGVTHVTIHRIERAEAVSIENFLKVARWLGARPESFTENTNCKIAEAA